MNEKPNEQDSLPSGPGRRQSEHVVNDTDSFFYTLSQISPVGIFRTDVHGNCLYVNERWCKITGIKQGDAIAGGWSRAMHPDDRDRVAQAWYTSKHAQLNFFLEYRIQRPDGEVRWVLGQAATERNSSGELVGYIGTITDITDIKQSEEALRKSEMKYRTLYDSTTDAVILWNETGFFDCNKAALVMFGCASKEDICSKQPVDLSPPVQPCGTSSLVLSSQHIATATERGGHRFEWICKRLDSGKLFPVEMAITAMDVDGMRIVQAAIRDISERKQLEVALRKSEETLNIAQNVAQVGSWFLDIPANRLEWSAETYRMFGIPPEEAISLETFVAAIHPDDRDFVLRAWEEAMAGAPYHIEHRVVVEGQERWVRERARIERDSAGRPLTGVGTVQDITKRKLSEEALRASERRYRLLVESSPFCIHEIDLKGRLQSMNRAGLNMLGLDDPGKIRDMPYLGAVSPQDAARVGALLHDAITNGTTSHFEFAAAGGVTRYFKSCFVPIKDTDGKVLKLMGITEDITERKNIEEELRKTKERYDFATAIGKLGTWDWNPVTGQLIWSDETFRLLGFAPGSFTPTYKAFLESVHPDDKKLLDDAVQAALRDRKPYDLDCRIVAGGGDELACHITGKVEFDENEQPIRMLGTIQDITERKRMEDALAESQARQSAILNNSPYQAWLKDTEGRYLKVNRAYADYVRLKDAKQAVGKTDFDFWPKELAEKYRADDAEVMATLGQKHVEEPSLDGERIHWVETFKTPIIDGNNQVLGTTGFARDITERKLAEEALRRSEKKFRTLFDSTSDMVLMMDETGFLDANRAALQGSGCTSLEEFCKKRPGDFSPPQQPCGANSMELARQHIAMALQKGKHRFEWMCKRFDSGEIFPAELSLTAMDMDGKRFIQVVVRDITERKQIEEQIHNLAFYDALTQLPNRRMLNDRMTQAMASSKRSGRYGALLFLDLDNFKSLNDTHGHAVGDLLLKEVARRISSCVREMDTVARFGGDEFVVMLTELDADKAESSVQAGIVAEKIRIALAEPYMLRVQQEEKADVIVEHHCTSSIGAVLFIGHEASAEDILKWADMAMYQAKDRGRNMVSFLDCRDAGPASQFSFFSGNDRTF